MTFLLLVPFSELFPVHLFDYGQPASGSEFMLTQHASVHLISTRQKFEVSTMTWSKFNTGLHTLNRARK